WFASQENCLDGIIERTVRIGNRFFVFKIAHITNATKNKFCTDYFAVINRKTFVKCAFHFWLVFIYLGYPCYSLLNGEHRGFRHIGTDAYNDFIKQWKSPVDNVYMTQRERIKCAGEQTDTGHSALFWLINFFFLKAGKAQPFLLQRHFP